MASAREIESDIDIDSDLQELEFGGEYDEFVEDFDYEAMGINPLSPTIAKPGSEDKVRVLAARYAAGLPLWHTEDCYDHGPGGALALGDEELVEDEEEEE